MAARFVVHSSDEPTFTPPPEHVLKVTPEDILRRSLPKMRRKLSRSKARHTWQVVDEAEILQRMKARADDKDPSPGVMRVLEDLALRYERDLPPARQKQADAVDKLVQRFPNFAPVCRWVSDQVRLCAVMRAPLHLPPMLLLGPPASVRPCSALSWRRHLGQKPVCVHWGRCRHPG